MPWISPGAVTWNEPSENHRAGAPWLHSPAQFHSFTPGLHTAEGPCCLLRALELQFSSENWELCLQQRKQTRGFIRRRASVVWSCVCDRNATAQVRMVFDKRHSGHCARTRAVGFVCGQGLSTNTAPKAHKNPKSG